MIDKASQMFIGDGLKYSLVAVLMVFAILIVIILIANVISAVINKTLNKSENVTPVKKESDTLVIDENDENLMAAILVATIDYQNEVKKDVRVVSVKEL